MKSRTLKALTIAGFLLTWEVIARLRVFSPFIFPTISGSFVWGLKNQSLLVASCWRTLRLLLTAILFSSIVSMTVGILTVVSGTFRTAVEALVSVFNPLPSISLLPFALLWFGLGERPILFITFFGSLWPFILNIVNGFTTIDRDLVKVGELFSQNRWQLMRHIQIPLALPGIVTGLRCAWGIAWRSVVAGELVFGAVGMEGGIGWVVYCNRFLLNPEGMVAAISLISLIGIFTENVLLDYVEKVTIKRWGMKR